MLIIKLRYHYHCKSALYYYNKQEKYLVGDKKWKKYEDKFWKHISIANALRDQYRF